MLVENLDIRGLDRKIREAGWTFFYMAGGVSATAFGSDLEKTARRAVKNLLATMKLQRCDSLDIAQVVVKRFLGLLYVTVSAHPRHIQQSMFLSHAERPAEG